MLTRPLCHKALETIPLAALDRHNPPLAALDRRASHGGGPPRPTLER